MAEKEVQKKADELRSRLQETLSTNKRLESELARATAKEKAAIETARALEQKARNLANEKEQMESMLQKLKIQTDVQGELTSKMQEVLKATEAERQAVLDKNAEIMKVTVELREQAVKQNETFLGQLKDFQELQRKVVDENTTLKQQLVKTLDYIKLLEKKQDAELQQKAMELQIEQRKVDSLQAALTEEGTRNIQQLREMKAMAENLSKAQKDLVAATNTAKQSLDIVKMYQDQVKTTTASFQESQKLLVAEQVKSNRLGSLCKQLQKQRDESKHAAGEAQAEGLHYRALLEAAGVTITPYVPAAPSAAASVEPETAGASGSAAEPAAVSSDTEGASSDAAASGSATASSTTAAAAEGQGPGSGEDAGGAT